MKLSFDDVGDKFVEINQLINSPKTRPMKIVKIFGPIISLQFLTNGNFQHFVILSTDHHGTHFTNRDEIFIFLSSLVVEQQVNSSNNVIWVWLFQFQMNSCGHIWNWHLSNIDMCLSLRGWKSPAETVISCNNSTCLFTTALLTRSQQSGSSFSSTIYGEKKHSRFFWVKTTHRQDPICHQVCHIVPVNITARGRSSMLLKLSCPVTDL